MRFIDFYQQPEVQVILEKADFQQTGTTGRVYSYLKTFIYSERYYRSWTLDEHYYISDICDLFRSEKFLRKGDFYLQMSLYRYCIEEVEEYLQKKYSSYLLEFVTKDYKQVSDTSVVTFIMSKIPGSELLLS